MYAIRHPGADVSHEPIIVLAHSPKDALAKEFRWVLKGGTWAPIEIGRLESGKPITSVCFTKYYVKAAVVLSSITRQR